MASMLMGYDVEAGDAEPITPHFLEQVQALHHRLGVPATLFVVGITLERWVPQFQAIATDPLFDIQQHTYSHQLLKTICIDDGKSLRIRLGVGLEEVRQEIRKATEVLKTCLGVECIGVTGPWTYYRGLRDRPDILQVLWEEGIRFCRTDGRNAQDWHPLPLEVQPYWYDQYAEPEAVYPKILEIPTHGWHDCIIRAEDWGGLGWTNLTGWIESVKPWIDQAAAEDKVFSMCGHDWSCIREDPKLQAMEAIFRYALERGLRVTSYRAFYEEYKQARASASAVAS